MGNYLIQWRQICYDDYEFFQETFEAEDLDKAISKAKDKHHRGKSFDQLCQTCTAIKKECVCQKK